MVLVKACNVIIKQVIPPVDSEVFACQFMSFCVLMSVSLQHGNDL